MSTKLFSNVLVYRLRDQHLHQITNLNDALGNRPAREPNAAQLNAWGFGLPAGAEDQFVEDIRPGVFVFSVVASERLMPGGVIRARVQRKVNEIQEQEKRRVYAREKNQIKDAIITEMLPKAFIQTKVVHCLVNGPYLFIGTTSAKTGENVLCLLREAVGSLAVRPVAVKNTPIETFTRWFTRQNTDSRFGLTGDFQANNNHDESDSLKGKGTSPESEGLSDLVEASGRRVTLLTLTWPTSLGDHLSMTVNEMLGLKGIKWPESIMDTVAADAGERGEEEDEREYAITVMRATFLLLAVELRLVLDALLQALGGEDIGDEELSVSEKFEQTLRHLAELGESYREKFGATIVVDAQDSEEEGDDITGGEGDPLYLEAVAFVRESKRASISAVQRKLKIGYNRAARMIELMEEQGIVTATNSNGSREVISASRKINEALDDLV